MIAASTDVLRRDSIAAMFRRRWGWLLAFGIVQVIAGAFAIAIPTLASVVAVAVFGWVMILSAVFQIAHAIRVREWPGFALHLLGGLLYGAAGILTLLYPFSGALALTLLIAGLFLADGILQSVLALRVKPREGWGWFLASGIASIVLGAFLAFGWPGTAMWALGVLLGVNLIFGGAMHCAVALECRRNQKRNLADEGSTRTAPAH